MDEIVQLEKQYFLDLAAAKQLKLDLKNALRPGLGEKSEERKPKEGALIKERRKPKNVIADGTDLAAFYSDTQMLASNVEENGDPKEQESGPGQWYRGHVVQSTWKTAKILLYTCTFSTPKSHKQYLSKGYVAKRVLSFQEKQGDYEWIASTLSTLGCDDKFHIGMFVCRWFNKKYLGHNHVPEDGIVEAFINGIVVEVGVNTKLTTYKIRFDAPISTEVWYSKGEAVTWRDVYVNRTATTASTMK
jgi:hypothetical protein